MQDIDFDELDRAVSSLIGGTPAADNNTSQTEPVAVNVTPPPSPAVEPAPAVSAPTPIVVNTTPVAAATVPPVVVSAPKPEPVQAPSNLVSNRPNLGRSMDMVRPIGGNVATASLTKPANLPSPSEIPSRKSMVVNPISLTELPPTNNPADRGITQPTVPIGGSVVENAPAVNNQQDSPFIPDVKVDKRPLGGSIEPDMPQPVKEQPPVYASAITPGGFINEKADISTDMPLPAELQNKLLEIESAESATNSPAPVIPETPVIPAEPVVVAETTVEPAQPVVEASPAAPTVNPEPAAIPEPTAPANIAAPGGTIPSTSISQQYSNTTADNMSLKTTGAIYDTSAFSNKSNIKPAKKKSNAWVWILTAVLVLIGAAIGVAIYYVVR